MIRYLLTLLAVCCIAPQLAAQTIDPSTIGVVAPGTAHYRVYVDGDEVSKHTTPHKAWESAVRHLAKSPESDVRYTLNAQWVVTADLVTAPPEPDEPDPVDPEPEPDPEPLPPDPSPGEITLEYIGAYTTPAILGECQIGGATQVRGWLNGDGTAYLRGYREFIDGESGGLQDSGALVRIPDPRIVDHASKLPKVSLLGSTRSISGIRDGNPDNPVQAEGMCVFGDRLWFNLFQFYNVSNNDDQFDLGNCGLDFSDPQHFKITDPDGQNRIAKHNRITKWVMPIPDLWKQAHPWLDEYELFIGGVQMTGSGTTSWGPSLFAVDIDTMIAKPLCYWSPSNPLPYQLPNDNGFDLAQPTSSRDIDYGTNEQHWRHTDGHVGAVIWKDKFIAIARVGLGHVSYKPQLEPGNSKTAPGYASNAYEMRIFVFDMADLDGSSPTTVRHQQEMQLDLPYIPDQFTVTGPNPKDPLIYRTAMNLASLMIDGDTLHVVESRANRDENRYSPTPIVKCYRIAEAVTE